MGDVEDRCTKLTRRIRELSTTREATPELVRALISARDLLERALRRRNRKRMLADLSAAERILADAS